MAAEAPERTTSAGGELLDGLDWRPWEARCEQCGEWFPLVWLMPYTGDGHGHDGVVTVAAVRCDLGVEHSLGVGPNFVVVRLVGVHRDRIGLRTPCPCGRIPPS